MQTQAKKTSLFSTQEKILIFTLCSVQFCHIIDFMIIMPLGPVLMRTFSLDPHQFGLLVSSYTLAAGFSGLLASFFIDRFDRKKALLFLFAGFGVGTLACSLVGNYLGLLMARTITGAFGGILGSMALAIVSDAIDMGRRGTAIGFLMSAFSLASIAGVPFSLALANHFNWQAPFTFLGGLAILITAFVAKNLPTMTAHIGKRTESPFAIIKSVLRSRNQLYGIGLMMSLVLGQFAVIPFLSPSMVANAGLAETRLPLIYLVGGAVSIISNPLIGRMSDRLGKHKVFLWFTGFSILPFWLVTNIGESSDLIVFFYTALFFLGMGGRMVPAQALVTGTVHPHHRGSFMSIVASVQQFAAAAASYLAGIIVTKNAAGHMNHYDWVGYWALLLTLVAMIFAKLLKTVEGKKD